MFSAIDFVSANEMFDELLFAAMARHPGGLSREGKRLEIPAKTIAGLLARGQPLRRLELLDGALLQQLAALGAEALAEAALISVGGSGLAAHAIKAGLVTRSRIYGARKFIRKR